MTQPTITRGQRLSLALQLAGLGASLFLKGNNAEKAQVTGEKVGGIAEQIADLIATVKQ